MAHRNLNSALQQSLENNEAFSYAHLVKFEKPLKTETGESDRSANAYSYISDGSFDIEWDDGTSDINGNPNGDQNYVANRLLKVGTVSETTQARASNINVEVSSVALNTTMSTSITTTSSSITATESIVDAGFSEGDTVSLSSPAVTLRLKSFSNNNKTVEVTVLKGTLSGSGACTITFNSSEVNGILTDSNATTYAGYINREVFIYKAHIDIDTGAIIGEPYLLFKGIIATGKLTEDPSKNSKVSWGVTSHWGDFVRVNGRLTSDSEHRALDGAGNSDRLATVRPEYGNDLGFLHSETAVNIISTYQVMETRYKEKRRGGLAGFFGGKKTVEYEVEVDREVDLRFNLEAKRLPVVYGVQRIDSFPIFTDTLTANSGKIYVAYALCEGEIGGIYDVYLDDQSSICVDKNDLDTRSPDSATAEVRCQGRMDRGDTLTPSSTSNNIFNLLYPGASFSTGTGNTYGWLDRGGIVNLGGLLTPNATPLNVISGGVSIGATGGAGITHEKGTSFTTPIDTKLILHTGKSWQTSDDLLSSIASSGGFKIQSDYFESTGDYWGPNHQLLDTAYVVAEYTVSEGEVTIPELEFVVKGKLLECYNYDFSYLEDTYYPAGGIVNFAAGDQVTIKNSVTDATISTVRIADIELYKDNNNVNAYRVRFKENPNLGSVTSFYMTDGTNNYYLATYDNIIHSGSVAETLVNDVSVAGGSQPGVDATTASGSSNAFNDASTLADYVALGENIIDAMEIVELSSILGSSFYVDYNSSTGVFSNIGSTQTNVATLTNAQIVLKDCIALATSASSTDNAYVGQFIEVTHKFIDNTVFVQRRKIIGYKGSTRVAKVDEPWTETSVPILNDTYKILSRGDTRVSTNPAIQLLDYITNERYGRGLSLENDINLSTFKNSALDCDTRSDVTMVFPGSSNIVNGDIYDLVDTGGVRRFQGTVRSSSTISGGLKQVIFKDVVGKVARKWNNWYEFQDGEYMWWNGYVYEIGTTGLVSAAPTGSSSVTMTLTRISGTGSSSLSIDLDYNRKTFEGNPVVKAYNATFDSYTSGYNLYDSDDVKYWRYLGWNSQSQNYVTRHQTNAVINTTKSVFENINGMLGHFNGILRYSNGRYELVIKTATDSFGSAQSISEDDIIGSINLEDAGQKGTYNRVSVSIPDPQNRYEGRSVAFFNSTYLKQDRNVAKKGDIKTPYITNYYNARINAKQYLEQSRKGLKITFKMGPKGLLLTAGSLIKVTNDRFNWTNKEFRISNLNFTDNCLVQVTAEEHSTEAYLIQSIANAQYNAGENSGGGATNIVAPTNLILPQADVNKLSQGRVRLQWTNSTNFSTDTHTAQIWRGTNNDIEHSGTIMVGTSKTNEFIDAPETEGTYYYWVRYEVIPKSKTKTLFSAYNATRYLGKETDFIFTQSAATTIRLRANNAFVTYDTDEVESPANQTITLTAEPFNQIDASNIQYQYKFTDGTTTTTTTPAGITNPTALTKTLAQLSLAKPSASESLAITVILQKVVTNDDSTTTTTDEATDTITLAGLQEGGTGAGALAIIISNEVHACPANSSGTVASGGFAGSGTTIEVYEGTNKLSTDTSSPYGVSTFRVTAGSNTGGVSGPTGTHSGSTFTVGNITALTSDTGTRPFNITIKFADGTETTVAKTQSFSKVKDGNPGSTGGSVNLAFTRNSTLPGATGAGSLPTDSNVTWTDGVPTGTDTLWAVKGNLAVGSSSWVWGTPYRVDGQAVAEIYFYSDSTTGSPPSFSAPDYNFTNNSYSAPTSWNKSPPSLGGNGHKVYVIVVLYSGSPSDTSASAATTSSASIYAQQTDGVDGAPSLRANLSNDTHTIPADFNGANGNYSNASTTLTILEGTTDVTTSWTITTAASSGVTISGANTATIAVTNMTNATTAGTVTFTATKTGYPTLTAIFSVTKQNAAEDGDPAIVYRIGGATGAISKSALGVFTPSSFTASAQKVDGQNTPVATTSGTLKVYRNGSSTASATSSTGSVSWPVTSGTTTIKVDLVVGSTVVDSETVPIVSDGTSGASARGVNLTTTNQVFAYNTSGQTPSPSTSTITATAVNTSGTPYYQFLVNGTSAQNGTSNTYTYAPPNYFVNLPVRVEVFLREGSTTSAVLSKDVMTVYGTQATEDGEDAFTVVLSNESHVIPANALGVAKTYADSGTDIRVFLGNTALTYSASGANTFSVSAAAGNSITPNSSPTTGSGGVVRSYGAANSMANNAFADKITYTIVARNSAGSAATFTKVQSFTKGNDGNPGSTGGSVNLAFTRSSTLPPATGTGTLPTGSSTITWSDGVPTGDDTLWAVKGNLAVGSSSWVWGTPYRVDGQAVAEIYFYSDSTTGSPPSFSVPSYNFTNNSYLAPSGWNKSPPSLGGDGHKVYVIVVLYSGSPSDTAASAATTSSASIYAQQTDGIDADTVDFYFKKIVAGGSLATPGSGANANGTPSTINGWYTDPASLSSSSAGVIYTIKGTFNGTTWSWNSPIPLQGSLVRELSVFARQVVGAGVPGFVIGTNLQRYGSFTFAIPGGAVESFTPPVGWDKVPQTLAANGDIIWEYRVVVSGEPGQTVQPTGISGLTKYAERTDGTAIIRADLSNPNVVITANNDGTVPSGNFAGSGTTLRVFEGDTLLDYANSGTTAGTWAIGASSNGSTVVSSGLTRHAAGSVQTGSSPSRYAVLGDIVALTPDVGTITFNIVGKKLDGTALTPFSIVQSFSKVRGGGAGPDGFRTVQGYVYYEKSVSPSVAPLLSGTSTYNIAAGKLFGSNTFVGTTGTLNVVDKWTNEPRTQNASSTNTFWSARYYGTEDANSPAGGITVNFSSVVQHTSFSGVVTFNSGTGAFEEGGGSITTIDGGNIDTGTVDAQQLTISNNSSSGAGIFMDGVNKRIDIRDGSALRVRIGKL